MIRLVDVGTNQTQIDMKDVEGDADGISRKMSLSASEYSALTSDPNAHNYKSNKKFVKFEMICPKAFRRVRQVCRKSRFSRSV